MDDTGFKNKKGLLTFFGILLLLMGLLALLIFLISVISVSAMTANVQPDQQLSMPSFYIGLIFYLVAAAVFIILGIGSIKATRWARSLTLLLSWYTVVVGIIITIFFIVWGSAFFDQINANAPNVNVAFFVRIFLYSFIIFFFIILPAIYIWIYQREDVIRTVEEYDPKVRWTDKCPLPLLALVVLLLYVSITPFFYFAFNFVAPFFGMFLTGWPAAILLFANSVFCVYLALEIYQMKMQAWYYTIYLSLFWIISLFLTLLFNDFMDIYRYMNFPPEQITMLENMGIFSSVNIFSMMLLYIIPYLVFLLYSRRYFEK